MRSDCRHLVTSTYSSGREVERCALYWAPAAPCACPDACERFAPRSEAAGSGLDLRAAAVLDLRDADVALLTDA